MSTELTALLNGQRDIHGRMSRSMDNLRKLGAGGINLASIETRIRILDSLWTKFEVQHELVRTCYKENYTESEYATEFFDTVENTYVQQRSKLSEYAERYKTVPSASATTTAQQSSDQSLKTALPRIKLPQFSGAFEDWPSFRDFFLSVIGKNSSISNIERFHYLRSCLQGPAENLIRPLSVTGENYDRAWALLKKHFENKKELIRSNFAAFTAVAKMKGETAEELSQIYHAVTTAVNEQESIGRPINTNGMDLFNHIVVELFDSRTRLEWEFSTCDSSDPPSHDALLDFITKRMLTLKAAKPKNTVRVSGDSSHSAKTQFSKQGSDSSRCSLCSERHSLMQCSQFKAKSASERKAIVEARRMCFNCLGNHPVAKYQSSRNCWTCKARHHSMLHDAFASPQSTGISTLSAVSKADDRKAILLATARVLVQDRRGNSHSVRVLIDQGSEVSIISEALVQRLRLPRAYTTVSIIGIGNSHSGSTRGKVTVSISSNVTGNSFSADAFILPRLSAYQRSSTKKITAPWSHILGLPLADPHYFENDPVELLLGAEVCSTIFEEGLRRGRPQEPIAQKTTLGWILSGGCDATSLQHHHGSFTCSADHDLIKLVHRFWEQEQEPVAPVRLTPEEEKCEDLFVSSHTRTQAGRYVVRLPFSSTPTALTFTRKPAERLLTAMERKCRQDAGFGDLYRAFMREYEDLKHMELVNASPEQENKALCYLPHHGVLRESSVTTKLRVIFNGSQKGGSEKSLNQQLLTGPNLLPAL